MTLKVRLILLGLPLVLILTANACRLLSPQEKAPTPSEPPTPAVLADTFFSGRAYIDSNGNRLLDEADPPLSGARFSVMGFGSLTDKDGYAWAMIPGGWDKPVTAHMAPPEGSAYTLIGPSEVILQSGKQTSAKFLFAPPDRPY